jgi:hypothetical protein
MKHPIAIAALVALLTPAAVLTTSAVRAQATAGEILEQARDRAREIEEFRRVLTGPDQNMRLASFDAMVKSGDEATRLIAYETGLASADGILRAMAFKAVLFSRNDLHLTLAVDPSAPKAIREASEQYLAKNGDGFVVPLGTKDPESGAFKSPNWKGQVSGSEFVFQYGSAASGSIKLAEDTTLNGIVRLDRGKTQFLATGSLR